MRLLASPVPHLRLQWLRCHQAPASAGHRAAFRMEPLAVADGEKRRPLFAPYHRGGRRIHIGIQVWAATVKRYTVLGCRYYDQLESASWLGCAGGTRGHWVSSRRLWQQRRPCDRQHVGQRAQRLRAGGRRSPCG